MNHHNHRESSIDNPASSIQYRVLSIKNADTSKQKSKFSKKYNSFYFMKLQAFSIEYQESRIDDQKKCIFGHFFVDYCLKNVKIPTCLPVPQGPVGDRYSGEPHVFVSADTRQKASFVNIEVKVKDPPSSGGIRPSLDGTI